MKSFILNRYSLFIILVMNTYILRAQQLHINLHKNHLYSIQSINSLFKTITIKGQLTHPISHAPFYYNQEISIITLTDVYTNSVDTNGMFSITIPASKIKQKNIIQVSTIQKDSTFPYLKQIITYRNFIKSKNELNKKLILPVEYIGIMKPIYTIRKRLAPGMPYTPLTPEIQTIPAYVYNTLEISLKDIEKNTYNTNRKMTYSFNKEIGQILFGKPARFGLNLYFD